jgi:AraC-like DNA-binding protein
MSHNQHQTLSGTTAGCTEWRIADLQLSHGVQRPGLAAAAMPELLIPVAGTLMAQQGNLEQILRPPADLLYLPGRLTEIRTSAFFGWRLRLDDNRLGRVAGELADHRVSPGRIRRHLSRSQPLQTHAGPERERMGLLLQLLELCRQQEPGGNGLMEAIRIDSAIERLVALLVCGTLLTARLADPGASPRDSRAEILDALIHWIRDNLDRPIQLAELARVSGYSERSLRNLFHDRFGCSPVQWMRRERLSIARDQLLDPEPSTCVSSVAEAVGYRHLSQFSRDFQQCHGLRPSDVLREGLRGRS